MSILYIMHKRINAINRIQRNVCFFLKIIYATRSSSPQRIRSNGLLNEIDLMNNLPIVLIVNENYMINTTK